MLLFLNLKEIKAKTKDYIKQKSDLNKSLFLYLIESNYFNFFFTSTSWNASKTSPSLMSL